MAQEVIDVAQRVAGLSRAACVTDRLEPENLGGLVDSSEDALRSYGDQRASVRALAATLPEGTRLLHANLPYCEAEVVWHVRHEMARTAEDVLSRRTRALILDARAAIAASPRVVEIIARELGRDPGWQARQIEHMNRLASQYLPIPTRGLHTRAS